MRGRHKFGAKPERVDNIRFASRKEAARYRELKSLLYGGRIKDLELQPKFVLHVDGEPLKIKSKGFPNGRTIAYFADFRYYDLHKQATIVEDVKGMDTPLSRHKRAHVEAQYGIEIVLI